MGQWSLLPRTAHGWCLSTRNHVLGSAQGHMRLHEIKSDLTRSLLIEILVISFPSCYLDEPHPRGTQKIDYHKLHWPTADFSLEEMVQLFSVRMLSWPRIMAKQNPLFRKILHSQLPNLLPPERPMTALQIPPKPIKNPVRNFSLGTDRDLEPLWGGRCRYHYPEPYLAPQEVHHDSGAIPHGIRCSLSAWKLLPGWRLAQKDAQINWLFLCWSWAFFPQ